ncbi:ABC transporter ATP-binding protein [Bradyrhizobium elkanii]|jgi:peptide/nickel transport system ATP-binding protein|uniref:Peptide/nickel transport system ATP-binding protein n=1 Tax=Bradyrhizobium elkanii TaxID=29448 RepID=A0ABV4F7Y4_BRAEL|nr:oligopeptide/dipeptide ABC transporter ATP-binding protein [Bradyrhizobium elkanii]MCP1750964.1 peptide/nickel transport system ATP-binding protein [Bradyrhizobium elkanii]MCP1976738.1 peptide/nickel transport system ATP-binding protein [Bradyrhizobium elkanii]MCS3888744.1 peptide/nickel transport system ATP-binding protein [Bradyrhizobium elkanii]MCS4212234.1 peptide/nickel transport system ATP-binding protein [Bradyrhizobium elkanii]MCW2192131.1 peptide/nickel transport system ATP-binding
MSAPLLQVNDLKKHFPVRGGLFGRSSGAVHAVDGVSFEVGRGETLSLVGESGCGKSTVGRAILRLFDITAGQVVLDGQRIDDLSPGGLHAIRRRLQVVFQDPFSSLNPRMRVRDILAEPIRNFGLAKSAADLEARVAELMDTVRLPHDALNRRPHEFSGGQRQRIGIARALAAEPDLIVCDEAVSALDVSVKAQIVNLLQDLQQQFGLALLFISHDLAVVEHMTHRVAVMYLGKIVEMAPSHKIFASPAHPYTRALLSAVPVPKPGAVRNPIVLKGDVPSPINPPSGCRFNTRCPFVFDRCKSEKPTLRSAGGGQWVACHLETLPETSGPAV